MKTFPSRILGSIRAKVWLCVLVAFTGFLLAAVASFRFSGIVSKNLTHMQEIDFKVTFIAHDALTSFREQTKLYENAFLTGDEDKVKAANKMSGEICARLHTMADLLKNSPSLRPADVKTLHDEFKAYSRMAEKLYGNLGGHEILLRQEDIQRLGQSRTKLLAGFEEMHQKVESDLRKIVSNTRNAASRTNTFIFFLFLSVFLVLIVVVNSVANKLLIKPLLVVHEAVTQLSEGDLSFHLPNTFRTGDEIGRLGIQMNQATQILKSLVMKVRSSSRELTSVTHRIEKTSSSVDVAATHQGEQLEKMTAAINMILSSISEVSHGVDVLSNAASESACTIQETAASNNEVANNARNLFHAVEEVKRSITGMTASIQQVADFTSTLKTVTESATESITGMDRSIKDIEAVTAETAMIALELRNDAEIGKGSVDAVIVGMNGIKDASLLTADAILSLSRKINSIRGIISTINEFMAQTNLLALNAAIIAAQSGISGKGFAVVADEIRRLSRSTAASADEIKSVIGGILDETEQTVASTKAVLKSIDEGEALTLKSGDALRKIVNGVEKSADRMGAIAGATVEQAKQTAHLKDGMTDVMKIVAKISTAMAEQQKGGQLILSAAGQIHSQTAQVQSSTTEQSKATSDIAMSIESINQLINNIKCACDLQVEESKSIVTSLEDMKKSNRVNLESTQTLHTIVAKLSGQMGVLQNEISFFETDQRHPEQDG